MKAVNGRLWLPTRVILLDIAVVGMFFAINLPVEQPVRHNIFTGKAQVSKRDSNLMSGLPNRLVISDLGINLSVAMGSYDKSRDSWPIDTTGAFYADTSVPVNNSNGMTLIYGHAQWPIFAGLVDIKPKAKARVTTDTGYEFKYSFQSVRQVLPSATDAIVDSGKPVLVLQTCSGAFDTYRSLYFFKLESVRRS